MSKLIVAVLLALFTAQAFAYGTCKPSASEFKKELKVVVDGDMATGFYLSVYRTSSKKPVIRELTTLGGNRNYTTYEAYRKVDGVPVTYLISGNLDTAFFYVVAPKLRAKFSEAELEALAFLNCK